MAAPLSVTIVGYFRQGMRHLFFCGVLMLIGYARALPVPVEPVDTARLVVYTSPLRMADVLSRPMATAGIEYRFTGQWALSVEGGVKAWRPYAADTQWVVPTGTAARIEVKRYVDLLPSQGAELYGSIEYRWIMDNDNHSFHYLADVPADGNGRTTERRQDDFVSTQRVSVVSVKAGRIIPLGRHVCLDIHAGIGLRWRVLRNTHREYFPDPALTPAEPFQPIVAWTKMTGDAREGLLPDANLGVKLGWRF